MVTKFRSFPYYNLRYKCSYQHTASNLWANKVRASLRASLMFDSNSTQYKRNLFSYLPWSFTIDLAWILHTRGVNEALTQTKLYQLNKIKFTFRKLKPQMEL